MTSAIKTMRWFWLVGLILLLGCLLWLALVPTGRIIYQTDFKHRSYVFDKLLPSQRVVKVELGQKIIAEPIYLTLYAPRPFTKAVLTIDFSDPPALVNLGVAHNKALWLYDFKTIYQSSVSYNQSAWQSLPNGDYQAQIEFDLSRAEYLNQRYAFMLSAPNLSSHQTFIVKKIKFELSGSNFKQLIIDNL